MSSLTDCKAIWDREINAQLAKGLPRDKAVKAAMQANPGLRELYVDIANQKPQAKAAVLGSAKAKWNREIDALFSKGTPKSQAATLVNKRFPGLRQQMVDEVNG